MGKDLGAKMRRAGWPNLDERLKLLHGIRWFCHHAANEIREVVADKLSRAGWSWGLLQRRHERWMALDRWRTILATGLLKQKQSEELEAMLLWSGALLSARQATTRLSQSNPGFCCLKQ
jgi:hypothetical protein